MAATEAPAPIRGPGHKPLGEGALRDHFHRVLERALRMALAERVVRVGPGHYTVAAAGSGGSHVVTGPPKWKYAWELRCDCKEDAGYKPWPLCVHIGAVLVRRWWSEQKVVTVGDDGRVLVGQDACDAGAPPQEYPGLIKEAAG